MSFAPFLGAYKVKMKVSRWNGISSLVLLIFWVLMALGTPLMDKHQLCKVLYKHRRKKVSCCCEELTVCTCHRRQQMVQADEIVGEEIRQYL